jgi:hypothetical protein
MRIAPAACAALVALALAGPAAAAYKPRLVAGGGGNETTLHVTWRAADDATQAATLYAPSAYTLGAPAVGAKVGTAAVTVVETARKNARVRQAGGITSADPATPALRAAATECTLNPLHEQVWAATLGGQAASLLIFVDRTTPAEAVLGSIKFQFCFRSPGIPEAQGGAPHGAKPIDLALTVTGALDAPTTPGDFLWHGLFTPFAAGTKTASATATVEAQSLLRVPRVVTLKKQRLGERVRLIGQVSEGGTPLGGASVRVFRDGQRIATVKTNEDAGYALTLPLRRSASFSVRAIVKERTTSCQGTSVAPAGCTGATVSGFSVRSREVAVMRRR